MAPFTRRAVVGGNGPAETSVALASGRLSRLRLKSARAELELAARRLAAVAPSRDAPDRRRASFRSYRSGLDWRDEPSQSLLTIAVFLFIPLSVLAIGCVNVINLQLARGMDEASELSLRLALGASRPRILRLLVLEVGALAAICAGLGCLGARLLLTRAGAYMPVPPAIDGSVLAFTVVLIVGVVCVAESSRCRPPRPRRLRPAGVSVSHAGAFA